MQSLSFKIIGWQLQKMLWILNYCLRPSWGAEIASTFRKIDNQKINGKQRISNWYSAIIFVSDDPALQQAGARVFREELSLRRRRLRLTAGRRQGAPRKDLGAANRREQASGACIRACQEMQRPVCAARSRLPARPSLNLPRCLCQRTPETTSGWYRRDLSILSRMLG